MNVAYNGNRNDDTVIVLEEPDNLTNQPIIPRDGESPRQKRNKSSSDEDGVHWKIKLENSLKFQRHILPFRQRYQWDCGICCVAMSLSSLQGRYELYNNLEYYKNKLEFGSSTWTIDLCYILREFNKSFNFYTNFPGVDPKYKGYYFYRDILDQDTERVYKRFGEASQLGISITVRRTHLDEILEHVLLKGPAIVLVNANLLQCLDCFWASNCWIFSCCLRRFFQGHYVLVTGFDLKNGWIYYNNPNFSDRSCRMYLKDFDKARNVSGTDCDVILVAE